MLLQLWLVPLLVAISLPSIFTAAPSQASSTTQKSNSKSPPASSIPAHTKSDRSGQPIVYTADHSRDLPDPNPPYRPTPSSPRNTIPTNIHELYDEIQPEGTDNKEEPENKGFVDPIDFNSFLSDVGYKGGGSKEIPIFASSSDSKDTFANFFNNGRNNGPNINIGGGKDIFVEPNFGGLSSAASDTKQRKHNGAGGSGDDDGFVDPNVQFRSLFDSSETANGFRPQDFLGSKDDSSGAEPSKGSQTRAYPSFTYTGRNGRGGDRDRGDRDRGDDGKTDAEYEPQANSNNNNNKYRSSYRQVDSRGDNDRDSGERQPAGSGSNSRGFDPYDDSSYYGGEYDDSPPAPQNPRNRQQGNGAQFHRRQGANDEEDRDSNSNYSPAVQETSHKPQASSPKAEGSGNGKAKCKKVNKLVDESEDYSGYVDPEPDYDPATYGGNDRYKRQASSGGNRGRQQQGRSANGNKRPMTCYVCEDEQGRYAERCSFDSKGDPKGNNGNYYTSSSTSYNDNGNRNRPQGGRGGKQGSSSDRYRRNPSLSASNSASKIVATTIASAPSATSTSTVSSIPAKTTAAPTTTESSSDRDKRQSGAPGGRNNYEDDDYSAENDGDFGGRVAGSGTGAERRNRDREEPEDREDDDSGDDYGSQGSQTTNDRGGNGEHDYVPPSTTQRHPTSTAGGGNRGNDGGPNYGFGPPQRSSGGSNNNNREFDFGPPRDFGRDNPSASGSSNSDRGFGAAGFDFSIPKEFDPDVQIRTSNTNNRPVFSGSSSQGNDFGLGDFDTGYDEYIKKYFPGFGEGGDAGSSSESTPGPSPASTSYRPTSGGGGGGGGGGGSGGGVGYAGSSPAPRGHGGQGGHGGYGNNGPVYHHTPNKEHTQHSNNYAPPPYYREQNDHPEHLDKLIGSFSQKDRSGCEKMHKGDMTCYVCRDARGMNKEECMYAAGDPNGKNTRMAYHESTEYSSPSLSVLPLPLQRPASAGSTPKSVPDADGKLLASHSSISEKVKSPLDYDFDY